MNDLYLRAFSGVSVALLLFQIAITRGPNLLDPLPALWDLIPVDQNYNASFQRQREYSNHYDHHVGPSNLTNTRQRFIAGYQAGNWSPVLDEEAPFQMQPTNDLWVDAVNGDNAQDGRTAATAFNTIQKAADLAGPGTTVHILPGIYRETVWPASSGSVAEPILYLAENGPGTAIIRGSEPASTLTWAQLTENVVGLSPNVDPTDIYYTDLSAWNLTSPPRLIVQLDQAGNVTNRLHLAREPDWRVTTEWKQHEFWWAADGGWDVAGCDPAASSEPETCDLAWRSMTQLTDRTNDSDPIGIESGNLSTLGSLIGATLVALDSKQGHYLYRRTIIGHDVDAGSVTVGWPAEYTEGSGDPGLGWGSKYYVEGKPFLLDTPGEWWYDEDTGRLYLWPPTSRHPAALNLEISRRDTGFNLKNRSHILIDGLTLEFFNEDAFSIVNWESEKAYGNVLRNAILRHANRGVRLEQDVRANSNPNNRIDGFLLENSEIAHMDTHAIRLSDWWENDAEPDSFTRSGVLNTVIRSTELHHLGFRSDEDNAVGAAFQFAHKLDFEGNHIHDVAHNGVQFLRSVIQSPREYNFAAEEIKTGEILIKDNIFERACQLTSDCGGLKIWGEPPDRHVFRDILITGNIFRDTFGWSYVSEKRKRWTGSEGSILRGMGGFGLYVDMASGIHAYRNIAYNNAWAGYLLFGTYRDGDIVYFNNVAANSLIGFSLGGVTFDTHGAVNTQLVNNIVINNELYGFRVADASRTFQNITLDHNLYFNNGWGQGWNPGAMELIHLNRSGLQYTHYQTLAELRTHTPWESHGLTDNPFFRNYNPADHDPHDGSWPDFHLSADSTRLIDQGTNALPFSLSVLLTHFGVDDPRQGTAFDIGRYEDRFAVLATPSAQAIEPGGVAHYILYLHPSDLPFPVSLDVTNPSPNLRLQLEPDTLNQFTRATLTITENLPGSSPLPGVWYTIPVTGRGDRFDYIANVNLLVGGTRTYLPVIFGQ